MDYFPSTQITAGDTVSYTVSLPQYAGFNLKIAFKQAVSAPVVFSFTDILGLFSPSIDTSSLPAGAYFVQILVSKGTEKHTLETFRATISPDLSTSTALLDPRSDNEKTLEAIQALIAGQMDGVQEFTIAGSSIKKMSLIELRKQEQIYKRRVRREQGLPAWGCSIAPRWQ